MLCKKNFSLAKTAMIRNVATIRIFCPVTTDHSLNNYDWHTQMIDEAGFAVADSHGKG